MKLPVPQSEAFTFGVKFYGELKVGWMAWLLSSGSYKLVAVVLDPKVHYSDDAVKQIVLTRFYRYLGAI